MSAFRAASLSTRRELRRAFKRLRPVAVASLLAVAGASPASDYAWSSGGFSGTGLPTTLTLNDTLSIQCQPGSCGTKVLDGSLLNNGSIFATDSIYFQYTSQVLTNGWQYQLQGDVGMGNIYAGGSFVNEASGSLVKTAGVGTSFIGISSQHKSGSLVDAMTGRLEFSASASFEGGALMLANLGTQIAFTGGDLTLGNGVKLYGSGLYQIGTNASVTGDLGATRLHFTGGTYTGNGATLTSDASWQAGTFAGSWTVASGKTLSAGGYVDRYILGTVTNDGTLITEGQIYFQYASQQITNNGTLNLHGDVGLATSYAGGTLVNNATLAKDKGTGTSTIQSINFTNNGGVIHAASGTLQFSGGNLEFNNGTRFTGAGQVLVNSNARFTGRIDSENLVLSGASFQGGNGLPFPTADMHGRTTITSGALNGQWDFAADHQLTLSAGAGLYVRGTVNNAGSFSANANLYFEYPSYVLNNSGTMALQGGAGLVNAYAGGSFNNSGTLNVAAGGGTSLIQGITTGVSGNVNLDSGTLHFSGGSLNLASTATLTAAAGTTAVLGGSNSFASGARLAGDGQFQIAGDASVTGNFGAKQLAFTQGSFTGTAAVLTSDATWTGNSNFAGAWTVSAGTTLAATASGNHYLRGSINNLGTLDTQGHLYFEYPSYQIANAGTLNLRGDVGLVNAYAGGTIVNTGIFAKVAGTGTSVVQGISFTNNAGVIAAQSGTLQFSGAGFAFNDGTRFTGAGQVVVSSSARFAGRIDAANLVLSGGSFTGGDGGANPVATLHGHTHLQSSNLEGQWTFAADHQLTVSGYAYVRGNVVNQGTMQTTANLYFEYPSYVLSNQGRLDLQGDVGLVNVYAGGTFDNSGTLVKSAGTGTSSLAGITLTNTGTIDVQAGTIALPANFTNAGTLKGLGTFSASTLTNDGHIAPGASPGTLTLASHLVLGDAGSFDLELGSAALHDQLVVQGNVTLGGTLALSCWGACSFAAGTDLLVLDGSGTLTGSFSNITFTGFTANAFEVHLDAANGDVWLHATQNITAAVPEPSTYGLMALGLGLLGWRARRRAA
ncbi:beta strand repeat-containing protein [Roseateles sp. P5_E7]